MRYLFRLVLVLAVLAGVAVLGYAFVGDLSPQRSATETPITLEVN
ncbi:MAG: hypothetical protein ACXIU7_12700 [Roseinatronobacter sp.]